MPATPRILPTNARASSCRAFASMTRSRSRAILRAARADAILLVVPAQAMRSVAKQLAAQRSPQARRSIACAKGIERGTHKFMTEIIAECAPKAVPAILSGPSFAADVARGLPTAVTLAAADGRWRQALAAALGIGDFPALSLDRCARRRDRRRREERARDCRRHRRRARARRQRAGGADHARLCRADAFRQAPTARSRKR